MGGLNLIMTDVLSSKRQIPALLDNHRWQGGLSGSELCFSFYYSINNYLLYSYFLIDSEIPGKTLVHTDGIDVL